MSGDDQLAQLRTLCPAAELWPEGERKVAYLPGVTFDAAGSPVTRDLLLWPFGRDGYNTRLFLSAGVPSSSTRTWSTFNIHGRSWYAVSWQYVTENMPWLEIIANHLRAFK